MANEQECVQTVANEQECVQTVANGQKCVQTGFCLYLARTCYSSRKVWKEFELFYK